MFDLLILAALLAAAGWALNERRRLRGQMPSQIEAQQGGGTASAPLTARLMAALSTRSASRTESEPALGADAATPSFDPIPPGASPASTGSSRPIPASAPPEIVRPPLPPTVVGALLQVAREWLAEPDSDERKVGAAAASEQVDRGPGTQPVSRGESQVSPPGAPAAEVSGSRWAETSGERWANGIPPAVDSR
jgi:hypothetical protein